MKTSSTLHIPQNTPIKSPYRLKIYIYLLFFVFLIPYAEPSYGNSCSDVFSGSEREKQNTTDSKTDSSTETNTVASLEEKKLSKSQYCQGRRCSKALWLYRNKRELADKPSLFMQHIMDQGTAVGELATEVFKDGVLVSQGHKQAAAALERTAALVAQNVPAIFEAAFIFEELLVRVDVLRNNFDGTWDLIEVKSTTNVNPKAHLDDVAIQKWVLDNNGIKVRKAILMHLNREYIRNQEEQSFGDKVSGFWSFLRGHLRNEELSSREKVYNLWSLSRNYVRNGELNLEELFVLEDVSEAIEPYYDAIEPELENIKSYIAQSVEPQELIGSKCKNPYICSFKSYCWTHARDGTIHTLGRINDKKRHELVEMGIKTISQIPEGYKLSDNQAVERLSHVRNEPQVTIESLTSHLNELKYPLYFLDFESTSYAVPQFEGSWPYRHLVTQYSLHIQESPGSPLIHKEYIHNDNSDPSREIAIRLLEDIPDDGGSIIVYHRPYEKTRTKELAEAIPELQEPLNSLIDRMWDLATPFAKRWYWNKDFNGSFSIKSILPVFAPEFSYSDLEIQSGDMAQRQYDIMLSLPKHSPERRRIINNLLRYCKRDTLAMVIILQKLQQAIENSS